MFESLKKWLYSTEQSNKLFNHPEDEKLHIALACLLYHIISADQHSSNKEKQLFSSILSHEFDLTQAQVKALYEKAQTLKSELKTDLHTISEYLKESPSKRMAFMNKLNQLIMLDGVKSNEISIFYDAMRELFPYTNDKGQSF